MNRFRPVLLALLLAAAVPAWADVGRDEAAAIAQRHVQGRVLSVEQANAGGRPAWRVKVLTGNGDVRVVMIDAGSGRPL